MPPLIFNREFLIAVGTTDRMVIENLPKCTIRVINLNDADNIAIWSIAIADKNAGDDTKETISLVHREEQMEASKDIGWEGEIDFDSTQKLIATIEGAVAADKLYVTIGYELRR